MGIVMTSGGVSKTYNYYPYDALYVDANGNLNANGNGRQIKEAYFNGTKYYPIGEKPPAKLVVMNQPSLVDYSDIVVVAYTSDDEVWYSPSYPNGIIPFNELRIYNRGTYSTECGVSPQDTDVAYNSDAHIGQAKRDSLQSCLGDVMYTPITYTGQSGESISSLNDKFYSQITDSANWYTCYGYVGPDVYAVATEYTNTNYGYKYVKIEFFTPFTYNPLQPYIESINSYGRLQHGSSTGNLKCTVDTNYGIDGMWSGTIKGHSTISESYNYSSEGISRFGNCPAAFVIGDKAVYCIYSQTFSYSNDAVEIQGNARIYDSNRYSPIVLYGVEPFHKNADSPTWSGNMAYAFWNWYYGGPVEFDALRIEWKGHSSVSPAYCVTNPRQITS